MARPFLRLRYERYRCKLTQEALANKAGLHRNFIINFESGRMIPTPEELFRLANVLLVSPPEILMREVKIPDPSPEPEEEPVKGLTV